MTFTNLPAELIARILQLADLSASVMCSMTCMRFYQISQDSRIQYKRMLDVCGMVDSGKTSHPVSERLDRLREYEHAWRTLAWSQSAEFAIDQSIHPDKITSCDGILAYLSYSFDGSTKVTVHRLPSKIRGVSYKTWSWTFPGKSVLLMVDPAQDLAMLYDYHSASTARGHSLPSQQVDVRCSPRKLSTGEVHPLAGGEDINFSVQSSQELSIQLVGTRVLTECWIEEQSGFQLDLFDWKLGRSVWKSTTRGRPLDRSRRAIGRLLALGSSHILHLVDDPVRLEVHEIGNTSSDARHIATFKLPKLAGGIGSVVNYVPSLSSGEGRLDDDSIFHHNPYPASVTFLVQPPHLGFEYRITIPTLSISTLVQQVKMRTDRSTSPVEIEWEAVLNSGACISPAVGPGWNAPLRIFSHSGTRYIALHHVHSKVDPDGIVVAQALDHCPRRVARARRDGEDSVAYACEYLNRFEDWREQDPELEAGSSLRALFDLRTPASAGSTSWMTTARCLKRVGGPGRSHEKQMFCGDSAFINLEWATNDDEPHLATVYSF